MRLIDPKASTNRLYVSDFVFEQMQKIPTIDAVPVVRCKDCVHWLNEDGMEDHVCLKIYDDAGMNDVAWIERKPDDFCSRGERKDGEEDGQ